MPNISGSLMFFFGRFFQSGPTRSVVTSVVVPYSNHSGGADVYVLPANQQTRGNQAPSSGSDEPVEVDNFSQLYYLIPAVSATSSGAPRYVRVRSFFCWTQGFLILFRLCCILYVECTRCTRWLCNGLGGDRDYRHVSPRGISCASGICLHFTITYGYTHVYTIASIPVVLGHHVRPSMNNLSRPAL